MFCVQCEQTIRTPAGNGCSYAQGMCGKTAETSDLQDLLIASLQGLSAWAVKAREYGIIDHEVDNFAPRAFFSTLTNVNFDSPRIVGYAREAIAMRDALKAQCLAKDANATVDNPMADLQLVSDDLGDLQRQAAEFTPNKDKATIGDNILGLRLLCLYGLKGAATHGARPRSWSVRQRYLCSVPQNHGVAGYLAFRYERSAGVFNGNRPDELQSDEHSGRR